MKLAISRPWVPLWDLLIVLEAEVFFALLLAVTTAKCVNALQALSIQPSCMKIPPGLTKVLQKLNPAFVPKVIQAAYKRIRNKSIVFKYESSNQEGQSSVCVLGEPPNVKVSVSSKTVL